MNCLWRKGRVVVSETLFIAGISLVALSLLAGIVVFVVQLNRKKKLKFQLDKEYGETNKV